MSRNYDQGLQYGISLVGNASPSNDPIWTDGYSQAELDDAQSKYGLVFPPDLIALLRERRPVQGYDWRTDDDQIRAILKWPLEGLLFDVENNDLWWPEWGLRPQTPEARAHVVADVVNEAPKLIPIFSHRFLPGDPNEAGNPVFSIYQSDVIYYGADLADYFDREFGGSTPPLPQHIKRIPFWSELVERNS
ncbi:SMI1/KNR4 family protein [Brevundimonas sp. NIBR10]|uniref:SMI1/KNR4 family protein n=1 Tax=Brevundimonas sp. NIBR10 TaxID=3015997 RepID=UPI0022F14F2F|nr:SMI1/KNR4 family protein [Brevundimonas sp. NIBR10]